MSLKVNEIRISYKDRIPAAQWQKITDSHKAYDVLYENWNRSSMAVQETFNVLLLNNGNFVKGIYTLSQGGLTGTLVDIRLLFAVVLKSLSVAVILSHNHPSGNLKPSKADRQITRKITKAAGLLDLKVLDHLILGPEGDYFSFADNNLM